MIRLITTIVFTVFSFVSSLFAQEIAGDWYGQLDIQGTKLRINFHVVNNDGTYTTTMDSPDQMAVGIPTNETIVKENSIKVSIKSMMITYEGTLVESVIKGTFTQGSMKIPLDLSRKKIEKSVAKKKSQEPSKPYPYKSIDVTFVNQKANIKLVGTLTLPKDIEKPAVAILISGSGPQNRDEEFLGHKPFLVVADFLTKNGIAVLRFDDRGVAKSEGTQKDATSADFATDVESAIAYLKTRDDINTKKIGLIGHSEGGFIAPMVASKNKKEVAFIILLAGTGVEGDKVLLSQGEKMGELVGISTKELAYNNKVRESLFNIIKKNTDLTIIKEKATTYLKTEQQNTENPFSKELTDEMINQQVKSLSSKWMVYFIKTNPRQFLKQVTCPVLALNGTKDVQVIPKLNLNGIKKGLKKSKDITIIKLDNLNHLFQTCETGAVDEYAKIEETFSPIALELIANWINKRF